MLARSASSSLVAASAIWIKQRSISRAWFHWPAICRMVSRRRMSRPVRFLPHGIEGLAQQRGEQLDAWSERGGVGRGGPMHDQGFARR